MLVASPHLFQAVSRQSVTSFSSSSRREILCSSPAAPFHREILPSSICSSVGPAAGLLSLYGMLQFANAHGRVVSAAVVTGACGSADGHHRCHRSQNVVVLLRGSAKLRQTNQIE